MIDLRIWTDLFRWSQQSLVYLKCHVFVSTRLSQALSNVVWLVVRRSCALLIAVAGLVPASVHILLAIAGHLSCLLLLIVLLNFVLSLQPRYRFLSFRQKSRRQHDSKRHNANKRDLQLGRNHDEVTLNPRAAPTPKDELCKLLRVLDRKSNELKEACSSAVTEANIQSIYKQLSWSSTRTEFESVYWLNHTLQTLWPALRTLLNNLLADTTKQSKEAEKYHEVKAKDVAKKKRKSTGSKCQMLIKKSDIQSNQAKLGVYLSCRRQLENLYKYRHRILKEGDEHLAQKVFVMICYLVKKFILCSKQHIVDQVTWLISSLSSWSPQSGGQSSGCQIEQKRIIELDLKEMLRKQRIKFKVPRKQQQRRRAKSAKVQTAQKVGPMQQIRFRSAPEFGLACNSRRRIFASSGLINLATMRRSRAKRQKLARAINEMMLEATREERPVAGPITKKVSKPYQKKPITVEELNLSDLAPKITSIKFLEKEDDALLAQTLRNGSNVPPSDASTMRLIVELTFKSGKDFRIALSSVPLLDRVQVIKFNMRIRLLVAVNHKNFDDQKNLEILNAFDSENLLPVFNHVQCSLIDMPQLDWRLQPKPGPRRAQTEALPKNLIRRLKAMGVTSNVPKPASNFSHSLPTLHPIRVINHSYFKYLVHAALFCLQRWFQPFDIRVGEKFYLKTLW